MPGLSSGETGVPDESRWAGEFEQSSSGLVCKRCHSSVPQLGSHSAKHVEWCKAVEHVVGRVRGER